MAAVPIVVAVGDSITAGTAIDGTTADMSPWPVFAAAKADGTWLNKGVSGRALDGVNTALAADVYANAASVCVVLSGTNDMTTDLKAATARTTVGTIDAALVANNVRPVWVTLLPRSDDAGANTRILAHNTWLAGFCATNGRQLIDAHAVFADGDNAPIAGLLNVDGLHPAPTGQKLLGDTIGDAIDLPRVPAKRLYANDQLFSDPNLLVDAGANGLADVLGSSVAAGSGTPTRTPSLVDRDGGHWQRFTYSGANLTDAAYVSTLSNFTHPLVSGDITDVALDVRMSSVVGLVWASVKYEAFKADNGACGSIAVTGTDNTTKHLSLALDTRLRGSFTTTGAAAKGRWVIYVRGSGSCVLDVGALHVFKRAATASAAALIVTGVV